MKIIKYNISVGLQSDNGNKLVPVEISWNEKNEELAKKEAYNGEYTIEDDGKSESIKSPTQLDIIEAQVTYTAMMTDTLLEV